MTLVDAGWAIGGFAVGLLSYMAVSVAFWKGFGWDRPWWLPKVSEWKWDGLALLGIAAMVVGTGVVNPWLVLVVFGALALVVAVWKGR